MRSQETKEKRGIRCMVHGAWCVKHGAWCMARCARVQGDLEGLGAYAWRGIPTPHAAQEGLREHLGGPRAPVSAACDALVSTTRSREAKRESPRRPKESKSAYERMHGKASQVPHAAQGGLREHPKRASRAKERSVRCTRSGHHAVQRDQVPGPEPGGRPRAQAWRGTQVAPCDPQSPRSAEECKHGAWGMDVRSLRRHRQERRRSGSRGQKSQDWLGKLEANVSEDHRNIQPGLTTLRALRQHSLSRSPMSSVRSLRRHRQRSRRSKEPKSETPGLTQRREAGG